ncbi:MAG: T6SS immunity protein Tdi1 domain-containing protein [Candidatus Korobacteraceae bacterium]
MELEAFKQVFHATSASGGSYYETSTDTSLRALVRTYGGKVYNYGLYRVLDAPSIDFYTRLVRDAFLELAEGAEAFGMDWQGNIFGLRIQPSRKVLLFQIGSGEAFEVSDSIKHFHNSELVEHPEESLNANLWYQWFESNKRPLAWTECVGYKKPLFLGGQYQLENLEIVDPRIYWELIGQLLTQVRQLPPGTPVTHIRIEPT